MMDANKRGISGIAAFLWELGTFFLLCLFLPLWLIFRPPVPDSAGPIRCRHCAEWAEPMLAYCQHCGKPVWDQRP